MRLWTEKTVSGTRRKEQNARGSTKKDMEKVTSRYGRERHRIN